MKPRVAMIAYACDPEGGGEHWLGWGWAEVAARDCEVHLITTPKSRAAIERHAARAGLHAHFVELPAWRRRLSERLGGTGSWLRKIWWQRQAARCAAQLHAQAPFALVHQTTFHTFRVPFDAATRLGIPAVWGPIAGGEHTPPGFESFLGEARGAERWRKIANRLWLALPSVQRSLRTASALFVSNRTTLDFLPEFCRAKAALVPPNALRDDVTLPAQSGSPAAPGRLSILYVGNCVPTRCIPLVLHALAELNDPRIGFTVVGDGPARAAWQQQAQALGVASNFAGQVGRAQLADFYAAADALVFPALRDAGGSALLEAMSLGLPVVCLDWGGPAEMVDAESGIKIPVTDPATTVRALAAALVRLRDEPEFRRALGAHAAVKARAQFTWEAKRELLKATYERLIAAP